MCGNSKSDGDIKEILCGGRDVKTFYMIVLAFAFNDFASFEVREDIEIPSDDGVVLVFREGRIVYFKTQRNELSNEIFDSILDVCYFLKDKYGCPVDSYVLCHPDVKLKSYGGAERGNVVIHLSSLESYDGDSVLEVLENKKINNEEFTFEDNVNHILLPFMNYRNKNDFEFKLRRYLFESMDDRIL